MAEAAQLSCRSCGAPLEQVFVDLGLSPISNAMRRPEQAGEAERFYPLKTFVCGQCKLVQIQDIESREAHFHGDYTYFSSFSASWLAHAEAYVAMMVERFGVTPSSQVVEVASNDGYLLQYFKQRGVPVLGVDPAANCAEAAWSERGVPTHVGFFGADLAAQLVAEGKAADITAANNVLAHVPDINDFVAGFKLLLKPKGVATFEFPHLLRLIEANYFDTIYHEHYSYLSLLAVERLFERHGLEVFDVEELKTHGGSLRIFAGHAGAHGPASDRVEAFRAKEERAGLDDLAAYADFAERVKGTKRRFLELLIGLKDQGQSIVAYGAPAKGNTLLNYCGVRGDFIDYAVDANPHKQGLLLPGTGIPVHAPDRIYQTRPDYVLILPWNLKDEIIGQMGRIREWGGRFILPLPEPIILE
ncbi:class I SAM-dependent methyltransferase [Phenylobacterium montanum]|uniref:Class I SAM-dependent methyltransferase n=1 Tax=Phenylobacterium montanum TaxID=2823693 RepID=A0A975ITZ3_9CAUL|nr:class I SAM-dependent methyltransferase [Caulobacter sp. S6]QUD87225.1 class I SAM-dependent methyltransferase [Caulobacter sp. S6]